MWKCEKEVEAKIRKRKDDIKVVINLEKGSNIDSIADSVFVKIGWVGQILYQYQNKRSQ